jgi:hypothetical protein
MHADSINGVEDEQITEITCTSGHFGRPECRYANRWPECERWTPKLKIYQDHFKAKLNKINRELFEEGWAI